MSQFATKIFTVLSISMLIANSSALADERLDLSRADNEFVQRLNDLVGGKFRPTGLNSTSQLPMPTSKILSAKFKHSEVERTGGVRDGGGNIVHRELFDFYESKGTKDITVADLERLVPLTNTVLEYLNLQVPAVGNPSGSALGNVLRSELSKKRIVLDVKPINSSACINQSMVGTAAQVSAACQNDLEVRFHLQSLIDIRDDYNRAGLIIHEMTLAWMRERNSSLDKDNLEAKVRQLVVLFFAKNLPKDSDFAGVVSKITSLKSYNRSEEHTSELQSH